jgi:hypothetical protein
MAGGEGHWPAFIPVTSFVGSADGMVDGTQFPDTAAGRKEAYEIAKARTFPHMDFLLVKA